MDLRWEILAGYGPLFVQILLVHCALPKERCRRPPLRAECAELTCKPKGA